MTENENIPPQSGTLIYHLRDVIKTRESEGVAFRLNVPSLQIAQGEKIALIGESGCGKSTLLDMLSFILQPSSVGSFRFRPQNSGVDSNKKKPKSDDAIDIKRYWDKNKQNTLGDLRRRHIGYVMQTGGLLPYLSVRDNINLSRSVLGMDDDGTAERLAKELGIHHHLNKLPEDLSTGERMRAVAQEGEGGLTSSLIRLWPAPAPLVHPVIQPATRPSASKPPSTGETSQPQP